MKSLLKKWQISLKQKGDKKLNGTQSERRSSTHLSANSQSSNSRSSSAAAVRFIPVHAATRTSYIQASRSRSSPQTTRCSYIQASR